MDSASHRTAHKGPILGSPLAQDGDGSVHHLPIPDLLDGNQVVLLEPVGDQPELAIVAATSGVDPDVPAGQVKGLSTGTGRGDQEEHP